jgi:hypothetical protein
MVSPVPQNGFVTRKYNEAAARRSALANDGGSTESARQAR